jgi:hypothetical protein
MDMCALIYDDKYNIKSNDSTWYDYFIIAIFIYIWDNVKCCEQKERLRNVYVLETVHFSNLVIYASVHSLVSQVVTSL